MVTRLQSDELQYLYSLPRSWNCTLFIYWTITCILHVQCSIALVTILIYMYIVCSTSSGSLRSKRVRGVWEQRTGFLMFCLHGKWGESQKWNMGVGEAKEGHTCRQTPGFWKPPFAGASERSSWLAGLSFLPLPLLLFHFRAAILCSRTPQKRLLHRLVQRLQNDNYIVCYDTIAKSLLIKLWSFPGHNRLPQQPYNLWKTLKLYSHCGIHLTAISLILWPCYYSHLFLSHQNAHSLSFKKTLFKQLPCQYSHILKSQLV